MEECQSNTLLTESSSVAEHNTENIPLITDHSDDESLLFIPPMPNNRKLCSRYWLEILIGSITLVFLLMIITVGILFIKDTKISFASSKECDKQSETGMFFMTKSINNRIHNLGKSCSIDNSETILLVHLQSSSFNTRSNFSFIYTAVSHTSIITFSFKKGWNWYLDNVSIRDTISNVELIEDGGFESGTMYAYCVCDSNLQRTKPTTARYSHTGSYVCEVKNFFSAVQLAQSVNTIVGRSYNVSFWLQSQGGGMDNNAAVYMSSACKMTVSLLQTKFIIIFFILYIL
jgi:hypothetical protein